MPGGFARGPGCHPFSRLTSLLASRAGLIALALALALPAAAQTPVPEGPQLLFLRHGNLWTADREGGNQRQVIASGGTMLRYLAEPQGNRVALVKRVGQLDALEVHDLGGGVTLLLHAAEGYIEHLAWSESGGTLLGYSYRSDPTAAYEIHLTRGYDAGARVYTLRPDEELVALYNAPDGVVLHTRDAIGLHWRLCQPRVSSLVRGHPGKTIGSMPLRGGGWLTAEYTTANGRRLSILSPTASALERKYSVDLTRSTVSWSTRPVFRTTAQQLTRAVLREEASSAAAGEIARVLVWDLKKGDLTRIALEGQLLLGAPQVEPGGTRFVICTQFADGSGYGTLPALWSYNSAGADPRLCVADGSDPQWWLPEAIPGVSPSPEDSEAASPFSDESEMEAMPLPPQLQPPIPVSAPEPEPEPAESIEPEPTEEVEAEPAAEVPVAQVVAPAEPEPIAVPAIPALEPVRLPEMESAPEPPPAPEPAPAPAQGLNEIELALMALDSGPMTEEAASPAAAWEAPLPVVAPEIALDHVESLMSLESVPIPSATTSFFDLSTTASELTAGPPAQLSEFAGDPAAALVAVEPGEVPESSSDLLNGDPAPAEPAVIEEPTEAEEPAPADSDDSG